MHGDMTQTRSRGAGLLLAGLQDCQPVCSNNPQTALTALSYSGDMTQTRSRRSAAFVPTAQAPALCNLKRWHRDLAAGARASCLARVWAVLSLDC